jgi:hypothetical protein
MDKDTLDTIPISNFMKEHDLSSQDVLLILKHHVNDLQFEKELGNVYNEDDWDDWSEGDLV